MQDHNAQPYRARPLRQTFLLKLIQRFGKNGLLRIIQVTMRDRLQDRLFPIAYEAQRHFQYRTGKTLEQQPCQLMKTGSAVGAKITQQRYFMVRIIAAF